MEDSALATGYIPDEDEEDADLELRPPVVTIMGHVRCRRRSSNVSHSRNIRLRLTTEKHLSWTPLDPPMSQPVKQGGSLSTLLLTRSNIRMKKSHSLTHQYVAFHDLLEPAHL